MRNLLGQCGKSRAGAYVHGNRSVVESLEMRQLATATVSTSTASSISNLSGDYFGQVQFGDNGYATGTPTVIVGESDTWDGWTYSAWDSNLNDGLDSGWVGASLSLGSVGNGFTVGTAGAATFSTSSASVHQVTLRAAVESSSLAVSFRDLTVSFYRGGDLIESVPVGSLSADTLDATDYNPKEAIATVSTTATDYDGVKITGQVRLQAAEGQYPAAADLFGQILIS